MPIIRKVIRRMPVKERPTISPSRCPPTDIAIPVLTRLFTVAAMKIANSATEKEISRRVIPETERVRASTSAMPEAAASR